MSTRGDGSIEIGANVRIGRDVVTGGKTEVRHYHLPDQPLELRGLHLPPRNALFVGRADVLADLAQRLADPGAVAALTGPGGMGKTQTAIEFAYQQQALFPGGCFWLRFNQPDLITSEIAACGREGRLSLPDYDALPQPEQVSLVQAAWAEPVARLLIFDNAEDPELVKAWLTSGGGCRVLITARRAAWPRTLTSHVVALSALDQTAALALLAQNNPVRLAAFASDLAAAEIVEALGGLPLALHCAGAYMVFYNLAPSAYLAELRAQAVLPHESLGDWLAEYESLPADHTPNVTATFDLSYQQLVKGADDEAAPLAQRLFQLLAYVAPAVPLPREVLARAAKVDDPKALTDALHFLANLGLVMLDTERRPVVHRLLQAFARLTSADPAADRVLVENAVADQAVEINATNLPARMVVLLPHLQTLVQEATYETAPIARLLNEFGDYLHTVASYAFAQSVYTQALAIDEKLFGPEHPYVAIRVNNLGMVLHALGNLVDARAACERALTIDEKFYGPEHANIATIANNLGAVLLDLGNKSEAQIMYERALAIDERVYGPESQEVGTDVNNLGLLLHDRGDFAGARAAYERALAIVKKVYGPDHPKVATTINNLGAVLQDVGDLTGARATYETALSIAEKVYGPEHPDIARTIFNLGTVLYVLGDLSGALAAFERASAIMEHYLPTHQNTKNVRLQVIAIKQKIANQKQSPFLPPSHPT